MIKDRFFYDKGNNTIFQILYVENDHYQWYAVCGNNSGMAWWSGGYNRLFESENIIFGDLETLKVLYVKV